LTLGSTLVAGGELGNGGGLEGELGQAITRGGEQRMVVYIPPLFSVSFRGFRGPFILHAASFFAMVSALSKGS